MRELFLWSRTRKVIALSVIDPESLQRIEHRLRFDPFGHRLEPHRTAYLGDRLNHAAVHGVLAMLLTNWPSIFSRSTGRLFK